MVAFLFWVPPMYLASSSLGMEGSRLNPQSIGLKDMSSVVSSGLNGALPSGWEAGWEKAGGPSQRHHTAQDGLSCAASASQCITNTGCICHSLITHRGSAGGCGAVRAKSLQLCLTFCDPMTHQALMSMEFSRQEYWSGLPFSFPGDLPDQGSVLLSSRPRT